MQRLFAETKKVFNRLDVLVNNAGVYKFLPLEEITDDEFHREFNINVLGTLLATKEAVKYFGPNGGSVINMSSIASAGEADASIYSGTKGAVDAITRGLADELGPRKIRVNAIAPAGVETEGTHSREAPCSGSSIAFSPLFRGRHDHKRRPASSSMLTPRSVPKPRTPHVALSVGTRLRRSICSEMPMKWWFLPARG
jgi:NAD(P)-dependent dehydrogenase (short-subunit alcohol dehydrogenase family)